MKNQLIIDKEAAIIAARKATLERIRHELTFEYYEDTLAFHAKVLNFHPELKKSIQHEHPVLIFLANNYSDSVEHITWEPKDVESLIAFDSPSNYSLDQETFEVWMKEDIECGLGLINRTFVKNLIICYSEGNGEHASLWLDTFRTFLTK